MIKEKKNFIPHPLKAYLGGWVSYRVVSELISNTRLGWARD
jgi:hypothetical protein